MTPEEFQALPAEEQRARIEAAGRTSTEGLPPAVKAAIERAEQQRLGEDPLPKLTVVDRPTNSS